MGFFDRFRSRAEPVTPDQLRQQLFDAVAARDQALLARLCAAHEAVVLASFAGWQRVPDEFRTPDKLSWYGPGLVAVAQHLASRGHPELLQGLAGPPAANPLTRWQRALAEVGALMTEHQYPEAAARLRATLDETAGLQGSGADTYRPVTLGRLGECLFQSGDADGARAPTEQALALCQASRDDDGVVAYLGNLYEIDRYRGDTAAAADQLDRLIATLDRLDRKPEAARWRRQLAIVRAGEPLCRVVAERDGVTCELSELPASPGRVRFLFERNRVTLRRSTAAVDLGTAAAERGELEAALACFQRATAADPFDPWPRYHAGTALTELGRYAEAAEAYRATELLAPGWYHCRADGWMAGRLAAGAIDHETFARVRQLLDGQLSPEQTVALAQATLQLSELGVLHLTLAEALAKLGRKTDAEAACRRGLGCAEEPDIRTRLLVALANATANPAERRQLLHEAIELSGNLVAAAMATMMLAAMVAAN